MTEVKLFINKIKPAIITNYDLSNLGLPHLTNSINNQKLIFNKLEDMLEFSEKGVLKGEPKLISKLRGYSLQKRDSLVKRFGNNQITILKSDELGIALGYPPSACRMFTDPDNTEDRILVNYHGIQYITYASILEENLKWLRERYGIPQALRTSVNIRRLYDKKFVTIKGGKYYVQSPNNSI